ncbi:hypothetical protein [Viscerimonas tarda]
MSIRINKLIYIYDTIVTLWLADKIVAAIGEEMELTGKAMKIAKENLKK